MEQPFILIGQGEGIDSLMTRMISHNEDLFVYPNISSKVQLYGAHGRTVCKGWQCTRHVHHMMLEINWVLEGCQSVLLDQQSFDQHAGDLVIISPMQAHEYQVTKSGSMKYLVFHVVIEDHRFLQLVEQHNLVHYPEGSQLNEALRPLMRYFQEVLVTDQPKLQVMASLYSLLAAIEQAFRNEKERFPANPNLSLAYMIAKEIEQLVITAEETSRSEKSGNWLQQIGQKLGVSERHCNRVFHQSFGMPPREYASVLRLQEAMHLLLNSEDTIEQIAYKIGYQSLPSFSRQFKNLSGIPPGLFRATHKNSLFYLTSISTGKQGQ